MSKMRIKNRKWIIFAAILVLFLIIGVFAFNAELKVVHYQVKSQKIARTVRVAFIADLHSCDYGEGQSDLLNAVDAQHPDIVLFGGDIFDQTLPPQNAIAVLAALPKKYPCYFVPGNHEYLTGEIGDIKQTVLHCGIKLLEGACETVTIHGQQINICGIDDAQAGESMMLGQLANAYKQADPHLFTILLAHRPEYIDAYLNYDFDLVLSGHAHGGQWRLPPLIDGLYAPGQGWFPKYAGGQYVFGEKTFIVSRGLCRESFGIPRIFNPPELVIIDIAAE